MRVTFSLPGGRSSSDVGPLVAALAVAFLASACGHEGERPPPREPPYETAAAPAVQSERGEAQVGYATWYGQALAGHKTTSGERFDPSKLTAAHRTLPLGTWVEVTRIDTGKAVEVRINDRGPFGHADRIIDLSRAAAKEIDMIKNGMARVRVRVISGPRS